MKLSHIFLDHNSRLHGRHSDSTFGERFFHIRWLVIAAACLMAYVSINLSGNNGDKYSYLKSKMLVSSKRA